MAKKTVKLNEPVRDTEPFDHGVRITYKGAVIAQSADDAEYDLLTENTIVEENINVQLVNIVPPVLVPFKIINNTQDTLNVGTTFTVFRISKGGIYVPTTVDYSADDNYILPAILAVDDDRFGVSAVISALTDNYDVLMNGVPVLYEKGEYYAELIFTQFTAATHFTLTVNDKPANGK